jgi:hypothetical protein
MYQGNFHTTSPVALLGIPDQLRNLPHSISSSKNHVDVRPRKSI